MYEVDAFAETDVRMIRAFLSDHPFAALVVDTAEGPCADHLPLLFDPSPSPRGRLLGHVARSNPLWRRFESGRGLAVFSGPNGYVSPAWYATKASDPRVVPTWNYAVVHASGKLRFFHESERIVDVVTRLTTRFESPRDEPWQVSDAPEDFIRRMAGAVVGVELRIERLIGKWKLSQNRPAADRDGVIAGLRRENGDRGAALADLMETGRRPEA